MKAPNLTITRKVFGYLNGHLTLLSLLVYIFGNDHDDCGTSHLTLTLMTLLRLLTGQFHDNYGWGHLTGLYRDNYGWGNLTELYRDNYVGASNWTLPQFLFAWRVSVNTNINIYRAEHAKWT